MRALLAWGLLGLAVGCAGPRDAGSGPDTAPASYVRAAHEPDGTAALEVALRSLRPARGRGPTIWLVGVTHLGTADYYAQLQQFLEAQPLVLYEGVGATNRDFALQSSGDFNLQAALARALGLEFQLRAIDYTRPHFRNSDLTVPELAHILAGAPVEEGEPSVEGANTELDHLLDAMHGSGFLGALARVTVALLERSPRLRAATQVVLVEVLSGLPNDLPRMEGLPAGFQNLLRVLIEERNRKVVDDLRQALRDKPRPSAIAVFYGAGHMTDLELRVRQELGYRPGEERWLTAFAINPRQAGLGEWEINLVRAWVRSRVGELKPMGSRLNN